MFNKGVRVLRPQNARMRWQILHVSGVNACAKLGIKQTRTRLLAKVRIKVNQQLRVKHAYSEHIINSR